MDHDTHYYHHNIDNQCKKERMPHTQWTAGKHFYLFDRVCHPCQEVHGKCKKKKQRESRDSLFSHVALHQTSYHQIPVHRLEHIEIECPPHPSWCCRIEEWNGRCQSIIVKLSHYNMPIIGFKRTNRITIKLCRRFFDTAPNSV